MNPIVEKALKAEQAYILEHLVYFVRTYVHIEDKDAPELIVPFRLWPKQTELLKSIERHRLNIILKARQLGITWLVLSYAVWTMLHPGKTVIALSRTETEAKELVRRVSVILRYMPEIVRGKEWGGPTWNATALTVTITHTNGLQSIFQAFASTPGAGRSFTANLIVLDEWAFQEWAGAIWKSALPTINRPDGGQVIGLSTAKRGTLFEQIWTESEVFNKVFLPWTTDPRRTPEWYEQSKKMLKDDVFAEYPSTPEEAFRQVGGAFFGEIREYIHATDILPTGTCRRYVSLDYGLDMLAAYWHRVDTQGNDVVYREIATPNLIASEAAAAIRAGSGTEQIDAWYAPPDLWNKDRHTGRSTAEVFSSAGIPLTMTSNERVQGWLDLKEWLQPFETRDEQTGEKRITARMRIMKDECPYLWRCLNSIQKDSRRPNDCANDPHELTHGPDALRAFAAGRPRPAEVPEDRDPREGPRYDEQVETFFEYTGGF